MTEKEYVEAYKYDTKIEERKEYNKQLIERYPFLKLPKGYYTDNGIEEYEYLYTWLDDMPDGWRLKFGMDFMEELREELIRVNYLNEYSLCQVKEKLGGLRWYDNGYPSDSKIGKITSKYEVLSEDTCIFCGKPVKYYTKGWIIYICEDCAKKYNKNQIAEIKEDV